MLIYEMDTSPDSWSTVYAPSALARTFPLHISEIGYFEAGDRYFTERDGKQAALLLYTLEGQGELFWNDQHALLSPGSAVLIYCDTWHRYHTVQGAPWKFRYLHLDGVGLDGYRTSLLSSLHPVYIKDSGAFGSRLDMIEAIDSQNGVLSCAETSHALSHLLLVMLRSDSASNTGTLLRRDDIHRVAAYVDLHLEEDIPIETLAGIAGLSKYHFIRVFTRHMGVTPHRYLQQVRIARAHVLLSTTDSPVSEIAASVGFLSTANFIRCFRQMVGSTPAQYRREVYRWPR